MYRCVGLGVLVDLLGSLISDFSTTLTLGGFGAHSTETLEFPLLLLGNSCMGARGLINTSFAHCGTLCTSVALLDLAGAGGGIAASLSCDQFLLYSPCCVSTIYEWGVSVWDLTTPGCHLPLVVESSTQIG